ncbi:caspase family protein, partial [Emticicia sp. W12TSBA100-4]|uniref:caspase family protein n=1 Tax=Emticicia sp. W12TSBA100-4 TaxID=3160965 RepID=UPI0033063480
YYDDINQPNLFVYCFGVEASDLKFTSNDPQYIKQLFVKQKGVLFKEVYVTAFTGVQTNAAAIKQTMERLGNDTRIGPQDVVLIFFSSHDLPSPDSTFNIEARDYAPLAPTNTTLRYKQDVLAFLEKRPSKHVVLMDVCFSGGKAHPDISKVVAETPPGWVMLSSSTGYELSFEHTDWQHCSFDYAIQQALRQGKADKNNDGQITLGELYDFLAKKVPAQNRSKNLTEQHPTIKKEGVEDTIIYVLK